MLYLICFREKLGEEVGERMWEGGEQERDQESDWLIGTWNIYFRLQIEAARTLGLLPF